MTELIDWDAIREGWKKLAEKKASFWHPEGCVCAKKGTCKWCEANKRALEDLEKRKR